MSSVLYDRKVPEDFHQVTDADIKWLKRAERKFKSNNAGALKHKVDKVLQ